MGDWHAIGCGCGFDLGDPDREFATGAEAIEQLRYWDDHSDITPKELVHPDGSRESWKAIRDG